MLQQARQKLLDNDPDNVFFRCVEDSCEAIMITDAKGVMVYVNHAWLAIYEYTWEEAIGQTPRLLRSGHQDTDFYNEMWKRILDPKIGHWKGDVVNRSKSGKEVPVLLTITPFRHRGEITGYMGIALDMREKKAMEAKIMQQDRLASVGLLASGIAHEIGTPMGVIRGRAEILKSQFKGNEKVASSIDVIVTQIDRISGLITNLLNLSRGHSKTSAVADMKNVCHEAVTLISQKLKENGIDVVNEVADGLTVKIPHHKLEQVVLNLLINSIHAIRAEISSGRNDDHRITMTAREMGKDLLLSVTDTGCGIEPKNFAKIFQPFFTTKPVGEGTGLGLSVSYQIVSEVGGEISVESTIGRGTTFTLWLPKAGA